MFDNFSGKYGKDRIFKIIFILAILVNIIVVISLSNNEKTFVNTGEKFKFHGIKNNVATIKDSTGNLLKVKEIKNDSINEDDTLSFIYDSVDFSSFEISYKNNVMFYDNSQLANDKVTLTLSNEKSYTYNPYDISSSSSNNPSIDTEVNLICKSVDMYKKNPSVFDYAPLLILFACLICLGCIHIIYPKEAWEFEHALYVKGGEPTNYAIISSRIVGVIIVIAPTFIFLRNYATF